MKIGDIVVRKSYDKDVSFKIVDIKEENGKTIYMLKGINIRIIADSTIDDLEEVKDDFIAEKDKILNRKVKRIINNAIEYRNMNLPIRKGQTNISNNEMVFGRPGRILHVDGDKEYMDTCLKVYKQLSLDAVGMAIDESEQPKIIVDIVKEVKPDIVVLTGHDSISKNVDDFLNIKEYRNSGYYIDAVKALRNYNSSYDELVIFAGACQSCYEMLLDAGANFASSPNRVLIHCLDPVFICEKIAYTKVDKIVSITDVIDNTITGIKGIGGLQTRGKYREGYPKSLYLQ